MITNTSMRKSKQADTEYRKRGKKLEGKGGSKRNSEKEGKQSMEIKLRQGESYR